MSGDSTRKARLWLALVFLVGGAIGAVFGYSFGHRSYAATVTTAAKPLNEPERRAKRVAEMTKELGLTPEQATKLDETIHAAHDQMKAIRDKAESDVDVARENARNQIRTFLTPEQKPKFEELVQKMDADRKKAQAATGK